MVLNIGLSKIECSSNTEIILFITPFLFKISGLLIFFITTPITFLLPKGTDTRNPFLIFITDLYVKHCLKGNETAIS